MPVKVMEACKIPSNVVYRIEKYIYGRAYYLAYCTLLFNSGYTKSKSDPCLFLKFYPDSGDRIYIWVHVDDTFTAATSIWLLDEFETTVKSQFKITVKSDIDLYLGIHFDYLPNGDVKITQPKLLQGLLEEYKDELANHRARFPITPQRKKSSKSTLDEPIDPSDYLHLEGALIYLTKSRPDIQTAVSFGATHSVNST